MAQVDMGVDGQTVSTRETISINTHRDNTGKEIGDTVENNVGRPMTTQDAISNPSEAYVTIGGQKIDLQSAMNANLVSVKNGMIEGVQTQQSPATSSHQPNRFMSPKAALLVKTGREIGNFDETFNAVLAHAGEESSDKSKAAVTRFGSEIGSSNYEQANTTANALIKDVLDHTEAALMAQYDEATVNGAMDFLMKEVEPAARASIFRGLFHGDSSMLNHIVERYQLKNRF